MQERLEMRRQEAEMRPKLSQDELLRNQEHEREAEFRSKALEPRFGYLDVFEKERQEKLQAMKEF